MKSKIKAIVNSLGVLITLSSCSTTPKEDLYLPPKPYLNEEETKQADQENYRKLQEWMIIFQETNYKILKKRKWIN